MGLRELMKFVFNAGLPHWSIGASAAGGSSSNVLPVVRLDGEEETHGGPTATTPPVAGFQRTGYVIHQQELAFQALRDGKVGAARAALLPLRATDFSRQREARTYLDLLRNSHADSDNVRSAVVKLILLEPHHGT